MCKPTTDAYIRFRPCWLRSGSDSPTRSSSKSSRHSGDVLANPCASISLPPPRPVQGTILRARTQIQILTSLSELAIGPQAEPRPIRRRRFSDETKVLSSSARRVAEPDQLTQPSPSSGPFFGGEVFRVPFPQIQSATSALQISRPC